MSELRFPDWQCALQGAILEANRVKLQQRIKDVERLIRVRRAQLDGQTDFLGERQALDDAVGLLHLLERYPLPGDEDSDPSELDRASRQTRRSVGTLETNAKNCGGRRGGSGLSLLEEEPYADSFSAVPD